MAIICPKCRSQYDITLFQFGRTLKCDCGYIINPIETAPVELFTTPFFAKFWKLARFIRQAIMKAAGVRQFNFYIISNWSNLINKRFLRNIAGRNQNGISGIGKKEAKHQVL